MPVPFVPFQNNTLFGLPFTQQHYLMYPNHMQGTAKSITAGDYNTTAQYYADFLPARSGHMWRIPAQERVLLIVATYRGALSTMVVHTWRCSNGTVLHKEMYKGK